jgi:uncharacterized YccA/Bax inhibitor family protein
MYIDPNSGGMLFQVLLVIFGLFSGMVLVFSSKIKMGIAKLRRTFREKGNDEATPESDPEINP